MRISAALLLLLTLGAACHRAAPANEAIRQGVLDYLASKQMGNLDVAVASVQMNGDKAEANVTIRPKGGQTDQSMAMTYLMEQQNGKWVVTGRKDTGGTPHEGAVAPSAPNPHGGGDSGKMPSPEDLPPTKK